MEKSDYDFKHPASLGHVIKPHPYSFDQIRGAIPKNTSLGYKHPPPIKIFARHKGDKSSAHYIATEEKHIKEESTTENEVVASYHVMAEEVPIVAEEIEADPALETLEDGSQSTVDDLKELGLGTPEDPWPIYVSALLTQKEEEEYYSLLVEYKDVFA